MCRSVLTWQKKHLEKCPNGGTSVLGFRLLISNFFTHLIIVINYYYLFFFLLKKLLHTLRVGDVQSRTCYSHVVFSCLVEVPSLFFLLLCGVLQASWPTAWVTLLSACHFAGGALALRRVLLQTAFYMLRDHV